MDLAEGKIQIKSMRHKKLQDVYDLCVNTWKLGLIVTLLTVY